ncbi:hypothetical protein Tco_0634941 [Tanacetum coccineum]
MEAHIAPMKPTQVNKITSSCKICSGPHDTQYCMEDLEQAFVEYASSRKMKPKEEGSVEFSATEHKNHEITIEDEEEVESEKEFDEEAKEEIEEDEKDNPKHFDTFPTMNELRYHQ